MKKLFFILKNGLKNPRFYIESINLKWKHILVLPLIVTLLMAINFCLAILPTLHSIQDDIQESIAYLPDFKVNQGKLELIQGEKALHYHSRQFQLVIDDQITNLSKEEGLVLSSDKNSDLQLTSTFNLLLIKNQVLVYTPENEQLFTFEHDFIANQEALTTLLNYGSQFNWIQILLMVIVTWIGSSLSHLYFLIITAILTGILNARLNFPLPFSVRMKLVILCSFVPILLIETIKLIWPAFYVPFYLLVGLTLFIIYHTFKQHTLFMHQLLSHMDISIIKEEDQKSKDNKKDSQ
ncbi:DUF1189 family protein [Facklamia miroungae]|uniref:Maltodextrin utilization protein YvdJ n=1 Tax=Facklamia miroungae TaxID=120956 RepID=A0A1G7V8M6_9LACT|nr:DUF1189 family protein [Facklamia miroungae]NKZ30267.1 DUF1189 family protein [Facklamia miroungae]SDG56074.1 Protein of unknown function [Facklamia miroungae]